jgi:hypothetical protein
MPGRGAEGVRGVFMATNFLIRFGFFKAHVNPYDPTMKPCREQLKMDEKYTESILIAPHDVRIPTR